jgi:hypothetical protein
MSHTLSASGVFMGDKLNVSGDLVPAEEMYEACRVMARHVVHLGDNRWDFSKLHTAPIDPAFTRLVESYLASVLKSDATRKGWKLPETTLVFPWMVRLFPDIHYIYWIRDPRDCILGRHVTDDLSAFGIPCEETDDARLRRAVSWKYQVELVKATPKPKRWLTVRFEDFVLEQEATLARLEDYLGFTPAKIPVDPSRIGQWKADTETHDFECFQADLVEHGYIESAARR